MLIINGTNEKNAKLGQKGSDFKTPLYLGNGWS